MEVTINKNSILAEFIIAAIDEFAKTKNLKLSQAFKYLKRYGAISFLQDCYEALHIQSFKSIVEDLSEYCKKRGGKL